MGVAKIINDWGFYGYYNIMEIKISVHKLHKKSLLFLCKLHNFQLLTVKKAPQTPLC